MATPLTLKAQKRTIMGRKVKKLRAEGLIPANIYGSDVQSLAVSISAADFKQIFQQAGETHIVNVELDGDAKGRPALIYDVQHHPLSRQVLHVDLRQVNLKEKIHSSIAVELTGDSPAEKAGAVILTLRSEVEVEALPTDLPDSLILDISKLENIGDALTVADLKVDRSKVELLLEPEEVLVKAEEPKQAEPEPEPVEEAGTAEGGEVPAAEGEAQPEASQKEE